MKLAGGRAQRAAFVEGGGEPAQAGRDGGGIIAREGKPQRVVPYESGERIRGDR